MNGPVVVMDDKRGRTGETLHVTYKEFEGSLSHYSTTKKALKHIRRIESAPINGKTLLESLQYKDGPSMWWLMHAQMAHEINLAVSFVENFDNFLRKTLPHSVRISKHSKHTDIVTQLCQAHGILLDYPLTNRVTPKFGMIRTGVRRAGASMLVHKNTYKRRKAYGEIIGGTIPDTTGKVLFLAGQSYRRSVYFPKQDRTRRGEYLLSRLAELLHEDVVYVDFLSQITQNEQVLRERLESNVPCFPIEMVLNDRDVPSHDQYMKKYNSLLAKPSFRKALAYKDINLWRFLEGSFRKMSTAPYLPFWLWLTDSLDKYFETNKPRAVIIPYETGPIAQVVIFAATKHQIRTIGLQHGLILDHCYQYTKKLFYDSKTPYGFLFPSTMLLFGSATMKLLTEYGYPRDRLIKFGNPTFFNTDTILHNMANKQLRSKYGVTKDVVLIILPGVVPADELSVDRNYNTQIWRTMLEYAQRPNTPTVLLKPHPNDDISFYSNIQSDYEKDNACIVQGDLLELIYISSITVSTYSTAVLDALAMRKPVIQVTFDNTDTHMPTDEYNATLKTPIPSLTDTVDSLLKNDSQKRSLADNAKSFIKDYYNIPENNPSVTLQQALKL